LTVLDASAALTSKNVVKQCPAGTSSAVFAKVQDFFPAAIVQSVVVVFAGVVQLSVAPGMVSVTRSLHAIVFAPSRAPLAIQEPSTSDICRGITAHVGAVAVPAHPPKLGLQ
jgi:hypothetical protein